MAVCTIGEYFTYSSLYKILLGSNKERQKKHRNAVIITRYEYLEVLLQKNTGRFSDFFNMSFYFIFSLGRYSINADVCLFVSLLQPVFTSMTPVQESYQFLLIPYLKLIVLVKDGLHSEENYIGCLYNVCYFSVSTILLFNVMEGRNVRTIMSNML